MLFNQTICTVVYLLPLSAYLVFLPGKMQKQSKSFLQIENFQRNWDFYGTNSAGSFGKDQCWISGKINPAWNFGYSGPLKIQCENRVTKHFVFGWACVSRKRSIETVMYKFAEGSFGVLIKTKFEKSRKKFFTKTIQFFFKATFFFFQRSGNYRTVQNFSQILFETGWVDPFR